MPNFKVALVQLTSSANPEKSFGEATALIRTAHAKGAKLICTPEYTNFMVNTAEETKDLSPTQATNEYLQKYKNLAKELNVWLNIGSIPILKKNGKIANRQFTINPIGEIAAYYDKIHLFDVSLPNGESYKESEHFHAGDKPVIASLPIAKMGLAICYDLRFPALFRAYAKKGATILNIPAAFTHSTGLAHWHTLLRARAIENACYVFAAAQCGQHDCGKKTFGHSLIIDPWGTILAEGGDEPGVIVADINTQLPDDIRQKIPTLDHEKTITL